MSTPFILYTPGSSYNVITPQAPGVPTSARGRPRGTAVTTGALQTTVTQAPEARLPGMDGDGEGDDELLPAMADDDYSAQLSWQSQSKDNLK